MASAVSCARSRRHGQKARGGDERADGGATDDDQLGGLDEDVERPSGEGEATEHGREHAGQSEEREHVVKGARSGRSSDL